MHWAVTSFWDMDAQLYELKRSDKNEYWTENKNGSQKAAPEF